MLVHKKGKGWWFIIAAVTAKQIHLQQNFIYKQQTLSRNILDLICSTEACQSFFFYSFKVSWQY